MLIKADLLALLQVLLVLISSYPPAVATSAPIINLGYAQYQGSVDTVKNITGFLGIRYAAPPVGDFRWAAPQPPSTISEVQQATTQPNECPQGGLGGTSLTNPYERTSMRKRAIGHSINPFEGTSMRRAVSQSEDSEDCLFLNVFTPGSEVVATSLGGLPVVVWIHGGGYIQGNASLYNGADLVMDSNHGVISVVMQYRLGLFGFLPGAAVKKGGALNAGLLDQNYALQWVQAYISSFGGDPTKVTIWGESSGAGSVIQHVVAHRGNTQPPLFRSVIISSPAMLSQYNYNDRIPEMLYSQVVDGTNCSSSSDTLSCLRAADYDTLQTLNFNISANAFFGTVIFAPVVDGTFIVERPTVTIRKGRLNGNHLLAVTDVYEGNLIADPTTTLDIADYLKLFFPNFGSAQAAGATVVYQNQGSNVDQLILALGDVTVVCPTYFLLKAFGERGWKGEFAIPPGMHGYDILYYFTSLDCCFGPVYNNSQLQTAFSNSFMAMVMYETPDDRYTPGDITPSWNSWGQGCTEMMFNETSAGLPDVHTFKTDVALLERCAYWLDVAAYTDQ